MLGLWRSLLPPSLAIAPPSLSGDFKVGLWRSISLWRSLLPLSLSGDLEVRALAISLSLAISNKLWMCGTESGSIWHETAFQILGEEEFVSALLELLNHRCYQIYCNGAMDWIYLVALLIFWFLPICCDAYVSRK